MYPPFARCLLKKVVAPVGQVKHGEDSGKGDAADDVDLLGPGRELVKPRLQEVVVPFRLHVDLTMVQLAHQPRVVLGQSILRVTGYGWRWRRRRAAASKHRLLEAGKRVS